MLNLNLNIIGSSVNQQGQPQKNGFAPYTYTDPYSSSLVLAIPGQIFYQGYDALFGATSAWSDVSTTVRSGAKGNYTGSLAVTGSNRTSIASVYGTPWDRYGYTSSLYVPPLAAIGGVTTGTQNLGVNLSTASAWCVEAWVAFPYSASGQQPNHYLAMKAVDPSGNNANKSYGFPIVTALKPNNPDGNWPTGIGVAPLTASLGINVYNTSYTGNVQNSQTLWPTSSAASNTGSMNYQWNHIAYSLDYYSFGGTTYPIYRAFWNGKMILEQPNISAIAGPPTASLGTPFKQIPTTPTQLMGVVEDNIYASTPGQTTNLSQSAAIFQDFRMYNGTNKNYTASFNVGTTVYPIVVARPY